MTLQSAVCRSNAASVSLLRRIYSDSGTPVMKGNIRWK